MEIDEWKGRLDTLNRFITDLYRWSQDAMVAMAAGSRTAGGQAQIWLSFGIGPRLPPVIMPRIQRITVPDLGPPVSHYCHVTRAGSHVWVAGVVGQAQDGGIPSDVVAQFDIAIAAMDKCLRAAGAGPEHVVKVQVFMTDITERPKINPRRIAYFGDDRPASTLVEVKGLVDPRMKVEIECQAFVD